jgi:hypothetical protein
MLCHAVMIYTDWILHLHILVYNFLEPIKIHSFLRRWWYWC